VLNGSNPKAFRGRTIAEAEAQRLTAESSSFLPTKGLDTELVPGGGLQAHEGITSVFGNPTHTIHEHVGNSVPDLQARLAANPKLSKASSFVDRVEAEAALSQGLAAKQADLSAFLGKPYDTVNPANNRLRLDIALGRTVGTVVYKSGTVAQGSGVKIIVDKVPSHAGNPYTIVTGYPTP
jgi:hypothetical protein